MKEEDKKKGLRAKTMPAKVNESRGGWRSGDDIQRAELWRKLAKGGSLSAPLLHQSEKAVLEISSKSLTAFTEPTCGRVRTPEEQQNDGALVPVRQEGA